MTIRARALVALFLANGLAVALIWWSGLDPHSLDGFAGRTNAAGRITALLGTYLVLVQLVLRTHVPWLVRAFGTDALRSAHTRNAYVAFGLLGAHAVLQIVGYALQDRVGIVAELELLMAHYEGMVLAIAGLLLLAALTLVAVGPIRHRIPWPAWRSLHLYTYVAIALSVPHQLATGSDFVDAPVAVVYWSGLEAAVLVVLLTARVPAIWRAAAAVERPHPAVVGVAGLVVAVYLVGSVRLSPAAPATLAATAAAPASARPASLPAAAGAAPAPVLKPLTAAIEGDVVDTPYGGAQVRVILSDGRIADVETVMLPAMTKRSKVISGAVEPWLRKRAVAAQSAEFDVLSGATYTSRAYMASLGSALHAAGLDVP